VVERNNSADHVVAATQCALKFHCHFGDEMAMLGLQGITISRSAHWSSVFCRVFICCSVFSFAPALALRLLSARLCPTCAQSDTIGFS
jgi:hypothetical protein